MSNPAPFPQRLRLFSGRNTHSATPVNGGPNFVTACDYLCDPAGNHVLPDDAEVTCRKCQKVMDR